MSRLGWDGRLFRQRVGSGRDRLSGEKRQGSETWIGNDCKREKKESRNIENGRVKGEGQEEGER